ncbi:NLR family CARD domain-containing protein 3 isoform X1 [Glycine max]|uniref:NLR family CARD domain-containing protein 3 isoform X1 n=1 Tax=Glycine max TaxID=3847 RepID=UPI001B355477|nr:NLR family CARD domain-containing protein 3 isoform X1 [Glycine max]
MAFTSTLSLYSHPQVRLRCQRLQSLAFTAAGVAQFAPLPPLNCRRTCSPRSFVVRASSSVEGSRARAGGSRRVYRQSQANAPLSSAPVKQIANVVAPVAAFFALTFVIWKLVEKLLVPTPKQLKYSTGESQSPSQGLKWSFAAGTNLLSQLGEKIERQSRQKLNEFARELRSFPSIDMSGRNFGDEGLFFLAESLAFNQIAEEVSFAANGITAAGLRAFDGVLQSNITLKTLDLSGNLVGDEGAKCLCDILVNNSSIEKLQLNSADLGDVGAKAIAEMLKKNSSLRVLELNNNMIEYSGFSSLAGALLENNSIRNIHLNGNYGGALGANALAKALESNKSIRELHLHGNSIGDEGICSLMTGLSSHKGKLTLLDIGNNSLTAKGSFHVAEYIRKSRNLLWLNLYMNDIGDEGAEKIAVALKENRSISTLDLGGNNIHVDGVNAIAQVLKDNLVITTLELSYNPIGPDGAKALAEVLKFHGNIKTLKLGWCQIGAKGAECIADALKYNTTISILDLRANGLRDEVCYPYLESFYPLIIFSNLHQSILGCYCFMNQLLQGAQSLARSLKVVNEALTSLDLGFNEIRDDGAFAIAQALKSNDDVAVTSLNIASNFLTKFGQGALADARDHVLEMTEKEINIFL